jgi:hypothetical protein
MNELDAGHDRATLEKVHSHPDVAFINPCQQRFSLMAFTILSKRSASSSKSVLKSSCWTSLCVSSYALSFQ